MLTLYIGAAEKALYGLKAHKQMIKYIGIENHWECIPEHCMFSTNSL
jgi:hypothetical protein